MKYKNEVKRRNEIPGVITVVRTWAFRFMCQGDHHLTNRDYKDLTFFQLTSDIGVGAEVKCGGTLIRDYVFETVYHNTLVSCFLFFTLF